MNNETQGGIRRGAGGGLVEQASLGGVRVCGEMERLKIIGYETDTCFADVGVADHPER